MILVEGKNEVSRKEFAEMHGWSQSYVTALGNSGRLVLSKSGDVMVAESKSLIEETAGSREDVKDRHAAARGSNSDSGDETASKVRRIRLASEARRAVAVAEQEEMKTAQMRGDLIAREDVDGAMKFTGATVRGLLDVLPDQLAPVLAPVTSLDEIHAILVDHCRNVLEQLGQAIHAQKDQLARGAKA